MHLGNKSQVQIFVVICEFIHYETKRDLIVFAVYYSLFWVDLKFMLQYILVLSFNSSPNSRCVRAKRSVISAGRSAFLFPSTMTVPFGDIPVLYIPVYCTKVIINAS